MKRKNEISDIQNQNEKQSIQRRDKQNQSIQSQTNKHQIRFILLLNNNKNWFILSINNNNNKNRFILSINNKTKKIKRFLMRI